MNKGFFMYLAAMAVVTYLIRMIPFTLMRRKIKSAYIKSLLYYVPYSVLGAMTFPYIFYSTGNIVTAAVGTAAAFVPAYMNKSLITVAITACAAAFVTGLFVH